MKFSHLILTLGVFTYATGPMIGDEFFETRVRPLLIKRCYECHQRQAEGGLRLDSRQAMLKGGNSGPAIAPNEPDKSLLLRAVNRESEELAMPPDNALTADEIQILTQWIHDGAPWPQDETVHAVPDEHGITDTERAFWSFQPISRQQPPQIDGSWGEHPIDAFVARKHRQNGLATAERSSPGTLLRRLTYDLIGLPPSPQQIAEFELAARESWNDAVHDQIERLLSSPHYGERWGQHWLDLVRYADTAGDAADFPVPEAYKYRNYVIDAFNDDKPYDQFVREQIAGDLMPTDDEEETWQRTIATGYIALSRRVGVVPETHIVIEDTLDNLGKTFLGLTIGCSRCHDHKFDPIPTSDYYALYGFFDCSTYPHAGAEHEPHRRNFVYRVGKERADEALAPHKEALNALRKRERAALERYRDLQRKPESELDYTRAESWQQLLSIRAELARFAETFPDLETAFAIRDGNSTDAHVQVQGNPRNRGPQVRRGFLQVLGGQTLSDDTSGSGRLQLAEWIASPDNPLTARVIANRVWHYHFGRGLVVSTSDFGVRGDRPSHPELLDYLASYLIENEWSIKSLHRLILTSRTWHRAIAR
ncbi:MAG: PSD1 domain-containing protein [Planctomycetales bacterium]|nr:PSD1 domain-containing protein [Planctomycetales bacterium]